MKSFASDNYAGAHPAVLEAVIDANSGHAPAYGDDPWSERFTEVMRGHFGEQAIALPVFNGTGANVVALQAALPRWGAVICATSAHINVDEGGAPERVGNLKLLGVEAPDGKLTPELVEREAWGWGTVHRAQPLVVSISQTTEFGTCYSPDEIAALAEQAHGLGMALHVDGSRISNAAAYLEASLKTLITDTGVDLLSLGGTKNGLLGAEAVVALNEQFVPGLPYVRKLSMQLGSKMRFLSAQLVAMFEGDLWITSAAHANTMAQRLHAGLASLASEQPGFALLHPAESNAVFARVPAEAAERARAVYPFYDWPGGESEVRLMCSFDTTEAEVDHLLELFAGHS
ncbi:threonine aldolase family protein [Leucobacter chinensis]|uniref:threonine aldolase family protein n=1 Tax=Leucobacter chinensis TaxID=2851010 RepID=UPI001C227FB0|nr:beta-eliminating lyase-related protein [Leucobacter chinensis]